MARHRFAGHVRTAAYDADFRPRHCGGETCLHDHHPSTGETRPTLGWFAPFRRVRARDKQGAVA